MSSSLTKSSKIVLTISLCKTKQKTRTVPENEVPTLLHMVYRFTVVLLMNRFLSSCLDS